MSDKASPTLKPQPSTAWGLGAIIIIIVLAADQASKYWIIEVLKLPEIRRVELSAIFDLTMVWNYGVSFGAFQAETGWQRWGLVALSGVISIVFAIWLTRTDRLWTRLALGLVIGGAIGNMIDRVRFGAVADFFDFSGLGFVYVFNVADAAITVGAILLIVDTFLEPKGSRAGAVKPNGDGQPSA